MHRRPRSIFLLAALLSLVAVGLPLAAQPFVHPGILQTRGDLEFMKQKVAAGEQPWKQAWENLLARPYSPRGFEPQPFVHLMRGTYGRSAAADR